MTSLLLDFAAIGLLGVVLLYALIRSLDEPGDIGPKALDRAVRERRAHGR